MNTDKKMQLACLICVHLCSSVANLVLLFDSDCRCHGWKRAVDASHLHEHRNRAAGRHRIRNLDIDLPQPDQPRGEARIVYVRVSYEGVVNDDSWLDVSLDGALRRFAIGRSAGNKSLACAI